MIFYYLAAVAAMGSANVASIAPPPDAAISPALQVSPSQKGANDPKPLGNIGGWVTTVDYPSMALQKQWSGTTNVSLTISETGEVQKCDILSSSGHVLLDAATCFALAQRATFAPALNNESKPIIGYYTKSVRWVVPESEPESEQKKSLKPANFPINGVDTVILVVEKNGEISNCNTSNTYSRKINFQPCAKLPKLPPQLDGNGKSVRKRIIISHITKVEVIPDEIIGAHSKLGKKKSK